MNAVDKVFQQKDHSGLVIGRRANSAEPASFGVLWERGKIRAAGPAHEVSALASRGVPVFEYPGAIITPGFIDSHTHFAQWAMKRRQVDLTGASTREEAARRVGLGSLAEGWVLGHGWDGNDWHEAPTREALDRVQPAPVFLDSLDVHAAWVNSAALAAAGVTRETQDPEGGRIVRDAAGEPTGLLQEFAVELVRRAVPHPPDQVLRSALLEGQARAHQFGVTGIHNVEDIRVLEAFRRLEQEDLLRLRVLFHPPVAMLEHLTSQGFRTGLSTRWITNGGIKLFLDGSLGSRTAWMLEPYEGSRDRGMPLATADAAGQAVHLAARHGIAATVHAIGDAAVRRALDLLEPLPKLPLPHRIEHFQCVHDADLGRAAAAGIVLSMQPAHLLVDIPLAERHWGRRGRGAYAFAGLVRRGSRLAFGSDAPVASLDPRLGVFAAMDRRALGTGRAAGWYAEERIDFLTTLEAYTAGPAAAAGWSARTGAIAPGLAADLVAWDVDPAILRGDGQAFLDARVRMTVVDGEVVVQS